MLSFITNLTDPLLDYIKDDPVRPDIPKEFRVGKNKFVSALVEDIPRAIVCVSLHDFIPEDVDDLSKDSEHPTTAIFYTIWSYAPGAGTELLKETVSQIKQQFPTIERFVTLSPKTELAKRFHLKNGADVFRENLNTVNYEYKTRV
jgi:Malonyl-CoA decarboxylase C-terminal domain